MDNYIFYKDSSGFKPKNISKGVYDAADYGHAFPSYSPISQHYVVKPYFMATSTNAEYKATLHSLKNTINYYFGQHPRFNFNAIIDQPMSLINIPSQNLGNGLQKGGTELTIEYKGIIKAVAKDSKENGILYDINDKEIGFILYKEGIIVLIDSTDLFTIETPAVTLTNHLNIKVPITTFKWCYYGATTLPRPTGIVLGHAFPAVALTPTSFTFVYADKGEFNHSNNPTYIKEESYNPVITDKRFVENIDSLNSETRALEIKNTVKIPFVGAQAPFQKDTYITKIGLYDENKELIAVASLANPLRKTEKREFLFKLKLDL